MDLSRRGFFLVPLLLAAACKTGGDVATPVPSEAKPPPPAPEPPAPPAPAPTGGTDADRALAARGGDAFAARLYRALPADKNLFFSPLSVRMALAMTFAGARGETAAEMKKTLSLEGEGNAIHDGFAAELRTLTAPTPEPPADAPDWQKSMAEQKKQTLRIVNRLWGQKGRKFEPAFLDLLSKSYAAPLEQLDFAKELEKSRLTINAFIEKETEKKIKDLIPAGMLAAEARLVLTNAVYFKASWEEPFSDSATTEGPFTVSASKTVKAKLMSATNHYRYAKADGAHVVSVPYASGRMSMILVVPEDKAGLAKVESSIDQATIARWTGALAGTRVHLTLPRFTTTSELRLATILGAMGMPTAFDGKKADFSGMDGTRELFIGDVLHKAFVAVDEKGTEAAAATAVMMKAGAAMPTDPPVEVRADHPFLFLLRDDKTGSVLFMGRVVDPSA